MCSQNSQRHDGCIKSKLNVTLQVLDELKRVLKEDPDLELNVSKTSVLPKGVTQQTAFDVLIVSVLKVSLVGVPIGTGACTQLCSKNM